MKVYVAGVVEMGIPMCEVFSTRTKATDHLFKWFEKRVAAMIDDKTESHPILHDKIDASADGKSYTFREQYRNWKSLREIMEELELLPGVKHYIDVYEVDKE